MFIIKKNRLHNYNDHMNQCGEIYGATTTFSCICL